MKQIKDVMRFDGTFRSYQKRVLDRSTRYLADKRVHIVAAPGSGKTTLGIELIRRLNAPCLVLSPSVNIRDQWLARVREAYLPDGEPEGFLSNSIKQPGKITAITYQALHSGMTKGKGKSTKAKAETETVEERDKTDEGEEQDVLTTASEESEEDYSEFDFFATVKKCGIRTLCLDEAHHLRSEWWKALEELVAKLPDCTVISLTATPPYDSTPAQWERYIGLCGPIDEEIIVPELVKEGSLCPHQDYVYFNLPTKEEEEAVRHFAEEAVKKADELFRDEEFTRYISTHRGLAAPSECADLFIQKPEYLSSLLIFLQAKGIVFSKQLLSMLGTGSRLPVMTVKWMEILLQGFLYEDTESYQCPEEYREQLIASLKARGLIQKKKVCLVANEAISKLLASSKGKLNSILTVTKAEYENLGEELRLLILTDYIKKEYLQAVGDPEKSVNELGVIPIFESIRRSFLGENGTGIPAAKGARITDKELRMGVLSGSVVILPDSAIEPFKQLLTEQGCKADIRPLGNTGYHKIQVVGTEFTASGLVTELFNRGEVRVLIGTKSLLGEGWDSPCINSLILASFVGSFMLSNQMRGRAIRVMKNKPDKVSNIWHLICMQPQSAADVRGSVQGGTVELKGEEETEDFATLKRRFEGFLGVHYEKNYIENGLQRLSTIKGPYTAPLLGKINESMLTMAADRKGLQKKWEDSLKPLNKMEVAVEAGVSKDFFKTGVTFAKTLCYIVLEAIVFLFCLGGLLSHPGFLRGLLDLILVIFSGVFLIKDISKLLHTATPERYMKTMGEGILSALKRFRTVTEPGTSVAVDSVGEDGMCFLYLKGGSEREKDVFADCVCEFFGRVENPRYLLMSTKVVSKYQMYYSVPELFGKKKEDAQLFFGRIKPYMGNYSLLYTRGQLGKQALLGAKLHSIANKNPDCVNKKKRVRNA